jgi:hypothetical protein
MITLKDFMETVDYRVTEGSQYMWQCYGEHAYRLDYWNQEQDGHSVSIIFDTRSHEVYEASAYDYTRERAYRLINPDYRAQHDEEAKHRGVMENQAWDDVDYVNLETDDDFLDKAMCIVQGLDYDTRVEVPLTLDDDKLFDLMRMAHQQDLTLNQLVEDILRNCISIHQTGGSDPIDFPLDYKSKKKKSKKSKG